MSGENTAGDALDPDQRNEPPVDQGTTGASQSLLDRKEVLGGEFSLQGVGLGACLGPWRGCLQPRPPWGRQPSARELPS